jgi:hypothetical protein
MRILTGCDLSSTIESSSEMVRESGIAHCAYGRMRR